VQRVVTINGTPLLSVTYARDTLGRISERTETIDGETHTDGYSYDPAGRLTDVYHDGVLATHYEYDENGNRLRRTTPSESVAGTYDDQDRLLSYGVVAYAYKDSGELLGRMNAATSETTLYTYDALGNLREVTLPGGTIIEYIVDGLGRRVGKKVGGSLVKGWLWGDALRPVAEFDGTGTVVARFVYAEGVNVPDLMIKGGATYRIVIDAIGSVRLVVHAATGAVAQRIDYEEFGRVLLDTNPGFQPFGFAGGLYDPDTGLVRFGARDYDPEVGRWTAKDPLLFDGGDTNLYTYAGNDPVNNQDPRGEETLQAGICRAFARFLPGCICGNTCPNPLPGGAPPPWAPPPPDPPPGIGICREKPDEEESERERCKRVKQQCIRFCERTLPTGDFGWRFQRCKNQCMEDHDCPRDS
jgi:RHS repeat-associated protein